jgi:hypothetical protein
MSDIRSLVVPPRRPLPAGRREQRQELLEQHVAASIRSRRTSWWKRKSIGIPGLVVAVACVVAAGWGLQNGGKAEGSLAVGCYSAPSLQSDTEVFDNNQEDPARTCRDYWERSGIIVNGVTVCLKRDGGIAAFPVKNACETLNLRPFLGISEQAARFAAFKEEAVQLFAADRCRPRGEIIAELRQKLQYFGLQGWSIDDSGYSEPWARGRPCASLAIDHKRSIVRIVPFPSVPVSGAAPSESGLPTGP